MVVSNKYTLLHNIYTILIYIYATGQMAWAVNSICTTVSKSAYNNVQVQQIY